MFENVRLSSSYAWVAELPNTDRFVLTTTRNSNAFGATETLPRLSHQLLSDVSLPNSDRLSLTTTHNDNTVSTAVSAIPRLTHKVLSEHDVSVTLAVGCTSPIGLGHPSSSRCRPSLVVSKSTAAPTSSIGLGHPSKRRISYIEADTAARPKQIIPSKRARIQSSTVKRRTKRFPRRELFVIPEDHEEAEQSYAAVAAIKPSSGSASDFAECATPTLPASPRCVSTQFSATSFNATAAALAPRSSSTGKPLAGPTQVLSPRLLFPANMAGAPNFQSLDGVMMNIVSVLVEAAAGEEDEVEGESESENDSRCGESEGKTSLTQAEWEAMYVEDKWGRWRYEVGWKVYFAAKRVRRLF